MRSEQEVNRIIKDFFKSWDAQEAAKKDDFDKLFDLWSTYKRKNKYSDLGSYTLAQFLEGCGIDWLRLVKKIPAFSFEYYPEIRLTIPKNIEEMGFHPFLNSSIEEIHYEGTIEEFKKIKMIGNTSLEPHIKIICTDGEYKRRFTL